jgi:hypothetical protein
VAEGILVAALAADGLLNRRFKPARIVRADAVRRLDKQGQAGLNTTAGFRIDH